MSLHSQDTTRSWIGTHISVYSGDVIRYGGELEGTWDYSGQGGYAFGVNFKYVLNNKYSIQVGINYSKHRLSGHNPYLRQDLPSEVKENIKLLSLPLTLTRTFKYNLFVGAGIQYDQQFLIYNYYNIEEQSGLAIHINFGKDFYLADGLVMYLSPEVLVHALVPKYAYDNQRRLTELGLKAGLRFGF